MLRSIDAVLAELTLGLCRIPSVTGDEKAIADRVEALCRSRFGAEVRRIGNGLVAGRVDPARQTLLLVGHLDTVPPHPGDGAARIEGDRVVGLGASDMKGGDAVMLALAQDLDLARLPVGLVLAFYDREEGPYDQNGLGAVLAAVPELKACKLALCLEGTDNQAQAGCVGSLQAHITFRGKSAHSARPWQGENAIHKAAPLLAELAARPRTRVKVDGLEFFEVVSATLARGGRAPNVVPDSFQLNLNWRFAPGKSLATAEQELRALVAGRAEVEVVDRAPAGRVCAGNALLRRLLDQGVELAPKQAWTDVARLTEAGIDAVNFGPGLTSQAHQAGEFVTIASLVRAYRLLRAVLEGAG